MSPSEKILRIAVLASTSGSDLPVLFAMDKRYYHFIFLLTNKAAAGAREKAQAAGIPDIFLDPTGKTREEYDREILQILEREKIDLVVLVGWMRLLSPELVERYAGRMINVHPSLLPAYGGGMDLNVHAAVLAAGEKETGATVHFVTEEPDAGPIILQRSCAISPDETAESLKLKVQKLEQEILPEAIAIIREGKLNY